MFFVFFVSLIAMLVFAAMTQGYFIAKTRKWEAAVMALIVFMLFRPDFFMNRIQPPYQQIEPTTLVERLDTAAEGRELRVVVSGPDFDTGDLKETTMLLTVGPEPSGQERLDAMGLIILEEEGIAKLDEPMFGTPVSSDLGSFDFYGDEPVQLAIVQVPADQMPKELIFIPALILLGLLAFLQRARATRQGEPA